MNDVFRKADEKRIAKEEAEKSQKKKVESKQTVAQQSKPKLPSAIFKKGSKKNFTQEKHSYEEVVVGKRVVIPRFYNEAFERRVGCVSAVTDSDSMTLSRTCRI